MQHCKIPPEEYGDPNTMYLRCVCFHYYPLGTMLIAGQPRLFNPSSKAGRLTGQESAVVENKELVLEYPRPVDEAAASWISENPKKYVDFFIKAVAIFYSGFF